MRLTRRRWMRKRMFRKKINTNGKMCENGLGAKTRNKGGDPSQVMHKTVPPCKVRSTQHRRPVLQEHTAAGSPNLRPRGMSRWGEPSVVWLNQRLFRNYFASSDPHHDISRCIFGHIFHIFGQFIWHIFWHYIWHSIWHNFWHGIRYLYLAYILTLYLAFYLT